MRRTALLVAVLLAVGVAGVPRAALAADDAHLELTDLKVAPASIDVSESAQIVTVEARVADPSRVTAVDIYVYSPNRRSHAGGTLSRVTAADGSALFRGELRIEPYVEAGAWHVDHVAVREHWSAERHYDRAALAEAGLDRTFDVVSPVEDFTPPQVVELIVSPSHVVLEEGQDHAWVTVRARVVDDVSGVSRSFSFAVTHHDSSRHHLRLSNFELVSGDANDGVYEAQGLVDATTLAGSYWARSMFLQDHAGNHGWYSTLEHATTGHPADLHVGPATAPSAARDVVARPGDGSATVSWIPPRFDGTRPITGYRITADPGGMTATTAPDATSAVVHGLTNGTAYTLDVEALNEIGYSTATRSRAIRATATPDAPDVTAPTVTSLEPAGTTFHGGEDEWKTLTFAVGFTDDISGWYTKPGDDYFSQITVVDPNGQATTGNAAWRPRSGHELEGVYDFLVHLPPEAPEGQYTVANVHLGDQAGNVADYSREYLAAAGHPTTFDLYRPRPPGSVADLTAVASPGSITLRWTPPSDDGHSPITGYEVQRDGAPVATVDGSTTSWTDQDVSEGATLTYAVVAVSDVGRSAAVDVTVQALRRPDAVADLTAVVDVATATLRWSPPADDGGAPITGYRIMRDGEEMATVAADVTQVPDAGLAPDTAYTYSVVALNEVGASPAADVTVLTPATPSAPQNMTARAGSGVGEIVATWEAPASDGRSALVGYQLFRDGALVAELPADTTSYTDSGRSLFQTSEYTVAAVNAVGAGATSSAACSAPSPWPAAVSAQLCSQDR